MTTDTRGAVFVLCVSMSFSNFLRAHRVKWVNEFGLLPGAN
jgi:hypothetical protein